MIERSNAPMNGAFKGRGRRYDTLLVCPIDGAALVQQGSELRCTDHAEHVYGFEAGILRLSHSELRVDLAARSEDYDTECLAAGWTSPDEDTFKSLPQSSMNGYPEGYWMRYAEATALLWRFLELIRRQNGVLPVGPVGEAAVIGAGMGWLAYALDVAGYQTVAVDARAGEHFGLGVYPIARYLRVQADPITPPLAAGAFDLVVFQDGLAEDAAAHEAALAHGIERLRPQGWLAVMAPLEPETLVKQQDLVSQAGLELAPVPHRDGWRARLKGLRGRLAGRDEEIPPVFLAQKLRG